MKAVNFPQANVQPVSYPGTDAMSHPMYQSADASVWCYWPSEAEVAAIAAGGPVWLIEKRHTFGRSLLVETVSPWCPRPAFNP